MIDYFTTEETNLVNFVYFEVNRSHLGVLLNMYEPLVKHIVRSKNNLYIVFRTQYDNDLFRIKYPEISNVESFKN